MGFDPGAPEGDKTVETTVVATLPPEQRVILVGCMNPKMIKSVVGAAKRNDVEVVMLESREVHLTCQFLCRSRHIQHCHSQELR